MSILINVSIKLQQLTLVEVKKSELSESLLEVCMDYGPKRHTWHTKVIKSYTVSTALKGIGQTKNSFQTPIGLHYIRAKIGEGLPALSIFEGRRPTGEIWSKDNAVLAPKDDWILSRIMWLSGKEFGINRLSNSDTMQRYIYIHGTHDESNLGKPLSHGCIRMSNDDVIELFDLVSAGTFVRINEE